jgi:hypothetical protein
VAAVNAHPEELVPLLRSDDPVVVRRAAWATTFLKPVPPFLIEPLAHSGLQIVQLIRAARAGALPNDPDELTEEKASSLFSQWTLAMEHAGAMASSQGILQQIAVELESAPLDGRLKGLANSVRTSLDELSQKK